MPKINDEAKNQRKALIIKHAFNIFSEKGYSNTTVDDIVKSSGVSKGGIYTYFKSKEEIFLAIAEERLNLRKNLINSFTEEMTSKEKLQKYIQWILDWVLDTKNILQIKFTFEFWSVTSRKADIKDASAERYNEIAQDLCDLLREGVENGEFKPDLDIDSMCYIILCSTDGLVFFTGVMGVGTNKAINETLTNMIIKTICKGD
jgi:AcrR family transcriptional regulator